MVYLSLGVSAQPSPADLQRATPAPGADPGKIIAVVDIDRAKVWALDLRDRTWHTYKALAGTKVSPFLPPPERRDLDPTSLPHVRRDRDATASGEGGFVALKVEGTNITEIAAYSAKSGDWVRQALHRPASGAAVPVISDDTELPR